MAQQLSRTMPDPPRRNRGWKIISCLGLALALTGCAQTWDDLSAHDPRGNGFSDDVRYRWRLLTDRRPPQVVLAEESDNDLRARAIRKLKEPLKDGGTAEQQQKMIALLAEVASSPKEPLCCRLAAVEKLGEFSDPAVVSPLEDAFHAKVNNVPKSPIVRTTVIDVLAKRNDEGVSKLLVLALRHDPEPEQAKWDSSQADVRIAAARGLANFPESEVAGALYQVLKEEKTRPVVNRNVALRRQAHQSLKSITGKEFGPEPEEWYAYLNEGYRPVVKRPESMIEQVGHWFRR